MKLVTLCATYRRPDLFKEMVNSFLKTRSSDDVKMFVYLTDDDEHISEYKKFINDLKCVFSVVGPNIGFVPAVELLAKTHHSEYYQMINDDHIYHTQDWDKVMIAALEQKCGGWGIAYPNDMIANGDINPYHHPSSEIVARKVIDVIGSIFPPDLRQFGADVWAKAFYGGFDGLCYVPEVKIEHRCAWATGKTKADENTAENYSGDSSAYGFKIINDWMRDHSESVREKILKEKEKGSDELRSISSEENQKRD